MIKNIGATAGAAILGFILLCVIIVNISGGIISGVWLLVVGEWRLVVIGIVLSLVMPIAWVIATLPVMGIGALLFADNQAPRRWVVAVAGFGMSLWQAALIGIWMLGVFFYFMGHESEGTTVPLILWAYSTAMAPLAYMAQNDDSEGTTLASILALAIFICAAAMHLFGASTLAIVIGVSILAIAEAIFTTTVGVAMTPPATRLGKSNMIDDAAAILDELESRFDLTAFRLVRRHVEEGFNRYPDDFAAMVERGESLRQMVLQAVAHTAADIVESGHCHLHRGVLDPMGPGEELINIFEATVDELIDTGAIDLAHGRAQKNALRRSSKSIG